MRAKREACQGGLDLESISKRRKVIANSCNNSLIWFRTDLRTMNHAALSEASQVAKETNGVVIGLYVVHEEEWKRHFMSPAKSDLILRTLKTLRQRLLEEFNIPLYVCHLKEDSFVTAFNTLDPTLYGYAKNKIAVKGHLKELSDNRMHFAHWLAQFCQAHQVGSVFYHHEYEVDEKERDFIVAKVLSESGILVTPIHGQCLIPPGLVLTKLNKPYNVFTPFKNQWLGILDHQFDFLVMPLKEVLPNPKTDLLDLEALGEIPEEVIPIDKDLKLRIEVDWSCDERDILEKSKQYISSKVTQYHEQRDLPSLKDGTSKLSAYLAIGSMSIRTLAYELYLEFPKLFPLASTKYQNVAALKTTSSDGPSVYLSELCWRDFYRHIIYFYPKVSRGCTFQSITEKIAWREGVEAEKDFEAWKQGKTGFPIVDAAMVQLNKTGWMHNRCRMIVASFLTKDLLIDWRKGEAYFSSVLIDSDFPSNNGGWQWTASTGTDSQPYFRILNPLLQGTRFDSKGTFVKEWLVQLRNLNEKQVHSPFETLSKSEFEKTGYWKPIVIHQEARDRTLNTFKRALGKEYTRNAMN